MSKRNAQNKTTVYKCGEYYLAIYTYYIYKCKF